MRMKREIPIADQGNLFRVTSVMKLHYETIISDGRKRSGRFTKVKISIIINTARLSKAHEGDRRNYIYNSRISVGIPEQSSDWSHYSAGMNKFSKLDNFSKYRVLRLTMIDFILLKKTVVTI